MTDLPARLDRLAERSARAARFNAGEMMVHPLTVAVLVKVAQAADSEGVRYAIGWMREGRLNHDPRAKDMDDFVDSLAALDVQLTKGEENP